MRKHFSYSIHNLIAHPLSEILHIVGMKRMSTWIHDITLPKEHNE